MKSLLFALFGLALASAGLAAAQPSTPPALPKIVLIGDSIRGGYGPRVAQMLQGKAQVISPEPNGGDSGNVLKVSCSGRHSCARACWARSNSHLSCSM